MNKTKRFLALALSVLFILPVLTGCSFNEQLFAKEIVTAFNVKEAEITGEIDMKKPHSVNMKFDGEIDTTNPSDLYLYLNVELKTSKLRNTTAKGEIFIEKNIIYVSKNLVRAMRQLTQTTATLNMFDSKYAHVQYVRYSQNDVKDIARFLDDFRGVITEETLPQFYDFFKDLKIKAINREDLYEIGFQLSSEDFVRIPELFVDYLTDNKEDLAYEFHDSKVKNIINNFIMNIDNPKELKNVFIAENLNDDIHFKKNIEKFYKNYTREYQDKLEEFRKQHTGSEIVYTLRRMPRQDKYRHSLTFNLNSRKDVDKIIFNAIVDIKAADIERKSIETTSSKANMVLDPNEDSRIPDSVNLYWEDFTSTVTVRSRFDEYDNFPSYETTYHLIDDRIYLPLRQICETFSEKVEWDDIERKAYIVREDEKIDMTGIIIDNKTYIKIRDFEKLNYTITYSQDGNKNYATIRR